MFKTIPINTKHFARTAYNFQRQIWLLLFEVPVVLFFMRVLDRRRLGDAHPWVTGTTEDGDRRSRSRSRESSLWRRTPSMRRPPPARPHTDTMSQSAYGHF